MNTIEINDFKELECGANVYQSASLGKTYEVVDYDVLSRDKELSYMDYINLTASLRVCAEFFDVNCIVAVKENIICSVALGATIDDAYVKAIDCNPAAISDSTIASSKEITFETAKQMCAMNVKNIIAPSFSKEAFSYLLDTNTKMVCIKTPLHEIQGFSAPDIKMTPFGALVQEQNSSKLTKDSFATVTTNKPSQQQAEDAIFAWKISKHLKSISALIVKDLVTKAVIQGATDEISAIEAATDLACESSKDAVLAYDGAISHTKSINAAIQGRIGLIIEAGDSKNSQEVLKYADKYGISMIFTKFRNNKY